MANSLQPAEPWARPQWVRVVGPALLALFQVAGSFGASRGQPQREPIDALAILLLLAGPASLTLLSRWHRPVAWFVAAVTLVYFLLDYPFGPVVLSLVVVMIASVVRGHRATAWLVAGTVLAGHFAVRSLVGDEPWSWGQLAGVTSWALIALVVAEVIRARRERAMTSRQARFEAQRRQAGEERLRIAQELHDVVAHHMSLINVQAGVALHLADKRPDQVQPALEAIKSASKEALTEMRSLVGVLRDDEGRAPRSPAATLRALDELVERSRHAGLTVRKHIEGDERHLPAAVELAAFRIAQESVTNVVRHAHARHADIHLDYGAEMLTVRIEDDGSAGHAVDRLQEGNGLRGMRERASALGGSLAIGPSDLGGLKVLATLPVGEPG